MGTRALIRIKEDKSTLCTLYRQYDGYIEGLGKDLKAALLNGRSEIINGFSGSHHAPLQFNGMPCLAAWLVGHLKNDKIGDVYLMPNSTKDAGQEYEYILSEKNNAVWCRIKDWNGKTIFNDYLSNLEVENEAT